MIRVHIERLANGGDGVSHLADGRVVFVPRAIPGDEVSIELVQSKKRWARAEIVEVLRPSDARREPGCGHFEVCGGCAFQHVGYEAEFEMKSEAALEAFARIARTTVPDGERHAAVSTAGYRIRARLHAERGRVGYKATGSHDVFDLKACPVLDPTLQAALPKISDAVRGQNGEIAIETAGNGQVAIVLRGRFDAASAQRLEQLAAVRGVRIEHSGATFGDASVDCEIATGVRAPVVSPSAGRFRQSNEQMTPVLRQLTRRRLGGGSTLVEYFCGSGSLTFALTDAYERITAYEFDSEAVAIARKIASTTGRTRIDFAQADLEEDPPAIPDGAHVLLDPPRTGAQAVCRSIADSAASRVVYVSCDVGTLARDCRILLDAGFALDSFDLVDMFPRTAHLEVVATLHRA